ncbi:MAG TPA: ABC transporter substrate-binding protein [Thermotogota bacterium]|nr:ABC transporter substrate-binding protein [Thermotogota bacterium]HPJ88751.1 ABC transporter substrate-binding protein [Thermotogota bacterium]HPR95712.1 ABC transporter substrate-binding protein [Thermotogota bacterium]
MKKFLLIAVLVLCVVFSSTVMAADVKRGGYPQLTPMNQGVLVQNFNPFSPNSLQAVKGLFYETLIYYNPMTGKTVPWLAKSFYWASDLLSVTFVLRDDVKWNDGEPFTVEDVYFTMMLAKNNKALDNSGIWGQGLEKVAITDYNKITFYFNDVNTTLIEYFSSIFIVPKHIWENVEDPLTWIGNTNPVGTGPFVYRDGSFTELTYTVDANPDYWQIAEDGKPLPYIAGIKYISTTNDQVAFKLANDDYDWAGYFVSNIDKVYVAADPEHHKYWLPAGNLVFLNLNNMRWPFDDPEVRRAVAFAVDPVEITRIMASGAIPAHISGVQAQYENLAAPFESDYGVEYDPDYAREILEDDGWKLNANGIYEKDGKALSVKLYTPTGWTDWVTGCEVISAQLKEAGIEAILTQAAWPTPYKDNIYTGDYEMCMGISVTGSSPQYQYTQWMHSKNWAPLGEDTANYYGMRYKNSKIDEVLDQYKRETEYEAQQALMQTAVGQFMKDLPSVPLFFNPVWYEYNTLRYEGWPNADNAYALPRFDVMHKMPILLNIHLK